MHKHIGALSLELKAQQQARNWDAVLDVMAQLEKRNAIDKVIAAQMRQQAWLEKLRSQATDIDHSARFVEIHSWRIQASQQDRCRCSRSFPQTGRLQERATIADRQSQRAMG